MLALANVVNLFADELARLGGRALAAALVLARASQSLLLGHDAPPFAPSTQQERCRCERTPRCGSKFGVKGQALAEYAIVLALTSSAAWARNLVDGVDARTVAAVLVGGVVLLFLLSARR